jgi:hypothetical protein
MITRRTLLIGGICFCHAGRTLAKSPRKLGCILYDNDPGNNDGGLAELARLALTSDYGNGLFAILNDLRTQLGVQPTFALYNDGVKNPNALSCETALLPEKLGQSTDGTVAVGRTLLGVLKEKSNDFGSAMTATCAHEFGHILQFKTVIDDLNRLPNNEIRTELHADYVSGYYGAHRKTIDPHYDVLTQAITQYEAGDRDAAGKLTYKAVSHGTYEQRGDAVYAGFLLGSGGPKDPKEVAARGLEYVRSLNIR